MTDKLLTRRQILSIFGGATGAAIVGTTQADLGSDEQGNLYGGTANMANLYQVGPGLWKGPLSVRGDVPKEDGHDFIQTDAGDDGNLYAMHHYNGGWDKQGLSTTSLETESISIRFGPNDDLQTVVDDAPEDALIYADKSQEVTHAPVSINTAGLTIKDLNLVAEDNAAAEDSDQELIEVHAPRVSFDNCDIDGNKAGQTEFPGRVSCIGFRTGASNGHVENCKIENADRHGVLVREDGCEVFDNDINNSRRYGVSTEGYDGNRAQDIDIDDNTIDGSDEVSCVEVAEYSDDVDVKDNTLKNAAEDGVHISDHNTSNTTGVTIAENTISSVGRHGVNNSNGQVHQDVTVRCNVIRDWSNQAIRVGAVQGVEVVGNTCLDATPADGGIQVYECQSDDEIKICGNVIKRVDGTFTGSWLLSRNQSDVLIRGNKVLNTPGNGIQFDGSSEENISVVNNVILNNDGRGITARDGDYYNVSDNIARGNSSANLQDDAAGVNAKVTGNIAP